MKNKERIKNILLRMVNPLAAGLYKLLSRLGIIGVLGRRETLCSLHIRENEEEIYKGQICKVLGYIFLAGVSTALVAVLYGTMREVSLKDGRYLSRSGFGEGDTKYSLILESDALQEREEVTVNVSEQYIGQERLERMWGEAFSYIDSAVLGENASADMIDSSLNLIEGIPGTSIRVEWKDIDYKYMFSDGSIRNSDLSEPVEISLCASLSYFDERAEHRIPIRIIPPARDVRTEFLQAVAEKLEESDSITNGGAEYTLPDSMEGYSLNWSEPEDNTVLLILILGAVAVAAIIPCMRSEQNKQMKKRSEQMLRDYPDIISKFTLLMTAGMTCRGAWEKICADYRGRHKQSDLRYAYEEMLTTCTEMKLGMPEARVYEHFGQRCGIDAYRHFGTILARNLRRGSRRLIELLEQEADEAFEGRKELVKRKGEETGTKLLAPMLGMLCLVIAIIVVPAFSSFG